MSLVASHSPNVHKQFWKSFPSTLESQPRIYRGLSVIPQDCLRSFLHTCTHSKYYFDHTYVFVVILLCSWIILRSFLLDPDKNLHKNLWGMTSAAYILVPKIVPLQFEKKMDVTHNLLTLLVWRKKMWPVNQVSHRLSYFYLIIKWRCIADTSILFS